MKPQLPFIHIVADYGTGDLAFAEVSQRLKHLLPQAQVLTTSASPFSTLNTGFIIAQLALYNPSQHLFIFSNTAPRKDDAQKRQNNEGEIFKYALLDNDVEVCAVDSGYCFSFIKPHIKTFKTIQVKNQGSQFRSRDFYPQAVAGIINNQPDKYLGKTLPTADIPDVPENRLMHIDAYGNLKTTIRQSQIKLKSGQNLRITLDHKTRTGIYANGNFAVKSGNLAFAPGSSGGDDPFMEVFLRSGNAFLHFAKPAVEAKITIKPL